jgi:hypothetical protein
MKKISAFSPFLLLILLPFLHTCKEFNGSLLMLYNLCFYKGGLPLLRAVLSFPLKAILISILFYFFIDKIAPKFSLFLLSVAACLAYYLLLPSAFFYNNLGVFFLASLACFKDTKQTRHLFFSLFFITLLHTLSAILIGIHFYGYNLSLFFISFIPIFSLYLLKNRETYPSKIILISLFPLTLFPVSFFVHSTVRLSLSLITGEILLATGIYLLIKGKSIKHLFSLFAISLPYLLFIDKQLLFPFLFLPISLLIGIIRYKLTLRKKNYIVANI